MRLLNEEEQDFCKRILKGDGNNNYLGNIIDHKLWGVRISIMRNPQNVDLLFTIQNHQPTTEEINMAIQKSQEISILILNVVNLIKLLEKDNYILLLQRSTNIPNQSSYGQGVVNLPFIKSNFSDPTISKLLIDFIDKEIFVTEEFRQFCKNKFIARDEQRFRRQFFITTSALIVAVLAVLANTFFNLLPRFTGGTKIKQEQVDIFRIEIKNLNSTLDSLNSLTKQTSENILNELKKITIIKQDNKTKKNNASR
jgi:hypothetical protein